MIRFYQVALFASLLVLYRGLALPVEDVSDGETQHIMRLVKETVEDLKHTMDTQIEGMEDELAIHQQNLHSVERRLATIETNDADIHRLEAELDEVRTNSRMRFSKLAGFLGSLMQWPGGHYALLQPITGCPVDLAFFGGTHMFQTIHTESQPSSGSSNAHSSALSPLTTYRSDRKNFVTMEFCQVRTAFNPDSWPRGSFCVHKINYVQCPPGFTYGNVLIDREDTDTVKNGRNNVGGTGPDKYLNFCCQNTGSAGDPIQLPTSSPFLLYRHGGTCQAVQGMEVSDEYLQIDTEDDSNIDSVFGSPPDVDMPGSIIKFHLCFYRKK